MLKPLKLKNQICSFVVVVFDISKVTKALQSKIYTRWDIPIIIMSMVER